MDKVTPAVSLSRPAQFPAQYADTCLAALSRTWQHAHWQMQERFGFHNIEPLTPDQLTHTFLADEIALIARAASGDLDRDDEDLAGEVNETIQSTMDLLFSNPLIASYQIPDDFWATKFGQIVARAIIWLRRDDLISITEAAEMRGVSVQAISNAVSTGRLRRYIDTDQPNPRRQTLVSRSEVEAM